MKFNTQICTTIEQSKRLLELGLKKETADMMYVVMIKDYKGRCIPEDERHYDLCLFIQEQFQNVGFCKYDYIPAWSLHRLIVMLPKELGLKHTLSDKNNMYVHITDIIKWLIKNNFFNKEYLNKK